MFEKFFSKIYTFVLAILFVVLVIYFSFMVDTRTEISAMTFQLLLAAFLIVVFFNLLRVFLSRDRGSYRSMILEKPLFNPKGKAEKLSLSYPLYPNFIAIYFDRTGDDPYTDELISIQAVRYENGYLTDGLFLPVKRSKERKRKKLLYFEDAYRYLKTYTKEFPIIVDNKDFANTYLREHLNSMMFKDSTDVVGISKMIYPTLEENGIEDINDFLRLDIDVEDNLYGAKIVTAVYLDYLRLNKYYTATTNNPFAKSNDLIPVLPDGTEGIVADKNTLSTTWEEDEKNYNESQYIPVEETKAESEVVTSKDSKVKENGNTKKSDSSFFKSLFSKKSNEEEKKPIAKKSEARVKKDRLDSKNKKVKTTELNDKEVKVNSSEDIKSIPSTKAPTSDIKVTSDEEFQKLLDQKMQDIAPAQVMDLDDYEYNPKNSSKMDN